MARIRPAFLFILLMLAGSHIPVRGQHPQNSRYSPASRYSLMAGPVPVLVFGDIGNAGTGFGVSFGGKYHMDDHWAVSGFLSAGRVGDTDQGTGNEGRGLEYRTWLVRLGGRAGYVFFEPQKTFNKRNFLVTRPVIRPVLYGGLSMLYFHPELNDPGSEPEQFTPLALCLSAGLGVGIAIFKNWSLNLLVGPVFGTSDYVDGYTSRASRSKDLLYTAEMTLQYRLPLKTR